MSWNLWLFVAALLGGLAVGCGAFGAHALKSILDPEALHVFEVAARYQMYHALALAVLSLVILRVENWTLQFAAGCFVLGTLIFSGSLYAVSVWGLKQYGMYTPIGGAFLILGWILVAVGSLTI